ncbi:MAG: TerB N-terminal domain-containing protein [Atopobiaceae bacterium]|nr:TerB N-terminal domain-containing protein [Atopobiaceae bacterium]
MSRAQDIVDSILQGERYTNSRLFDDKVYVDEPIIRTGASAYGPSPVRPRERRTSLPQELAKLRRMARGRKRALWGYSYSADSAKLFVEQARLVAAYEDDYAGVVDAASVRGTYVGYEDLSDHQLRCYFAWRTQVRRGERPPAPAAFVRLRTYELLNGIGAEPSEEGLAELKMLADTYISDEYVAETFAAWLRDYVVYYGLNVDLVSVARDERSSAIAAVAVLRRAENAILAGEGSERVASNDLAAPAEEELLDALVRLSRYRADRSRFIRNRREDVAWVVSRVFADMVVHCSKRRKTGLIDGWFGKSTRTSYTMFRSAMFWTDVPHEDATYEVSPHESYVCSRGFWWHELPARRLERNAELGALMHAIDARMRRMAQDAHPLKEKPLPKYQAKFVDKRIEELASLRAAEEAARITIDRSALSSIRSAALRTRDALLTDEERGEPAPKEGSNREGAQRGSRAQFRGNEDCLSAAPSGPRTGHLTVPSGQGEEAPTFAVAEPHDEGAPVGVDVPAGAAPAVIAPDASGATFSDEHKALLRALLAGETLDGFDALFVSLAVDAINEAFLDELGDTVIEFDGETPTLVEDYLEDVRAAVA